MEFTPGRAQVIFDEDEFKPLRTPKTPTTPNLHETVATNFQQLQIHPRPINAALNMLSPYAKEFVPQSRNSAADVVNINNDAFGHQLLQEQALQQQQQQHYQRYSNGYQQNHFQQQALPQQQQQQHYAQQMMQMTAKSVQDRLNPTYNNYQPLQHQQQQQQQQQQLQRQHVHEQQHYQRANNNNNNNARYQHQQTSQQQHHRQQAHSNANKFSNNTASSSALTSPTTTESTDSVEQIALDYLKTVMQCLNQNPGQFDTVATRFLNIYEGMENNQYVLANAMEDIFEESIQNPNFRYMGAKLYNLLHMLNPKSDSFFHTLLKCKLDFHQQQVLEYLQTNQMQKVRETALFLAELYMQLSYGGDEAQRIQLIAENIIYSLKQLLSVTLRDNLSDKDAADNVRCICLTLKLAGYDLTTDCGADMAQIIAQLEAINAQAPGKYPLAANVINLQKNNWGRKSSYASFSSTNDDEQHGASGEPSRQTESLRISDEPIFYGPDGRELTAEESEFLCNGIAPDSATDDEEPGAGDPDVEYDLEMDEETERAYKEFCKLKNTGNP